MPEPAATCAAGRRLSDPAPHLRQMLWRDRDDAVRQEGLSASPVGAEEGPHQFALRFHAVLGNAAAVPAVEHTDLVGEEILRLPLEDAEQVVGILGLCKVLVEQADPIQDPTAEQPCRKM